MLRIICGIPPVDPLLEPTLRDADALADADRRDLTPSDEVVYRGSRYLKLGRDLRHGQDHAARTGFRRVVRRRLASRRPVISTVPPAGHSWHRIIAPTIALLFSISAVRRRRTAAARSRTWRASAGTPIRDR